MGSEGNMQAVFCGKCSIARRDPSAPCPNCEVRRVAGIGDVEPNDVHELVHMAVGEMTMRSGKAHIANLEDDGNWHVHSIEPPKKWNDLKAATMSPERIERIRLEAEEELWQMQPWWRRALRYLGFGRREAA